MVKLNIGSTLDSDALALLNYGVKFENLTGGQRAAITKVVNGTQKKTYNTKKPKKIGRRITKEALSKTYAGDGKNYSRNIIDGLLIANGNGTVLALESSEQRLVKSLPNHAFVICEHNPLTYESLSNNRSPNIIGLIKGDIREVKNFEFKFKYAWLDFCNTYGANKESLELLKDTLNPCEIIAFTFAFRGWRRVGKPLKNSYESKPQETSEKIDKNDYAFYLIKELQNIYRNHEFYKRVIYRDRAPMLCMIMKRRDLEIKDV